MTIEILFEGEFAINGRVSLRTLAHTYTGLQKAIERAYLDISRGGISKGERIHKDDYKITDFYLEEIRNGSFISKFKECNSTLRSAIDKVSKAITDPYELAASHGEIVHNQILKEAEGRIPQETREVQTYEKALSNPKLFIPKAYGEKSIGSNINKSLSPLRNSEGENSIKYILTGDESHEFEFDKRIASRFTSVISGKELGVELIYDAFLIGLDTDNLKGTIRHKSNNLKATIYFVESSDYNSVSEYLKTDDHGQPLTSMKFLGYSVKEQSMPDLSAGDVVFKRLLGKEDE